jgi:hypothetical protein
MKERMKEGMKERRKEGTKMGEEKPSIITSKKKQKGTQKVETNSNCCPHRMAAHEQGWSDVIGRTRRTGARRE